MYDRLEESHWESSLRFVVEAGALQYIYMHSNMRHAGDSRDHVWCLCIRVR